MKQIFTLSREVNNDRSIDAYKYQVSEEVAQQWYANKHPTLKAGLNREGMPFGTWLDINRIQII